MERTDLEKLVESIKQGDKPYNGDRLQRLETTLVLMFRHLERIEVDNHNTNHTTKVYNCGQCDKG